MILNYITITKINIIKLVVKIKIKMIISKMFTRMNHFSKPSKSLLAQHTTFKYATHFAKQGKQKIVGSWLFLAAAGVLGMIVLGGYTRLTHSGLSMADWKPYTKKYPSTNQEWNVEFDKYKKCVQYQTVNRNITLEGFKPIYRVQFLHRQMGMWLGYFFMIPLAYFTARGHITPALRNRLIGILGLGALQGGIGWWMVKSGLNQKPDYQSRPRVSPYRLMTHLMMATTLYAALLWHSFALLIKPPVVQANQLLKIAYLRKLRITGVVLLHCLMLNIFTGALVAGIGAGEVYNTWPLMNGKVLPQTSFERQPKWTNFFENRALVQFNHRTMAYVTSGVSGYLLYLILKNKMNTPASFAGILAFALINYQAVSGILTLLNLVPPQRANIHQMTAILTLSSVILMVYLTRRPKIPYIPKINISPQ